jgi:alkanesulfonate monooxygenase
MPNSFILLSLADRILLLKSIEVNLVLTAFLHYDEIERFGKEVIPLVRKLEAEGRGKDPEEEIRRTGAVDEKRN